jgi:uncharacterized membrane protein YfcA
MQLCIGTSLAIIVPTSIRSYLAHRSKGAVIPDVILMWSLSAVVGAVLGSLLAAAAPAALFKVAFVIFTAFIGVKMMFGSGWRIRARLPGRVAQFGYGLLTGLVSSLVGVAGGSVSNAVLTLYGQPIQRAVATSVGRLAPHAGPASVIARLRVFDRLGADGAGIELYGFLWSEIGASLVEATTRNWLWNIPDACVSAIYCELAVSVSFFVQPDQTSVARACAKPGTKGQTRCTFWWNGDAKLIRGL